MSFTTSHPVADVTIEDLWVSFEDSESSLIDPESARHRALGSEYRIIRTADLRYAARWRQQALNGP